MPVVQEMEISGIERRTDGRTAAVQFSMRGVPSTFDRPIALSVGPSASQPNRISDGRDVFSVAGVAISRPAGGRETPKRTITERRQRGGGGGGGTTESLNAAMNSRTQSPDQTVRCRPFRPSVHSVFSSSQMSGICPPPFCPALADASTLNRKSPSRHLTPDLRDNHPTFISA